MRPHVRASSIAVFLIVAAAVACLDTSAPLLDTPHSAASISIEPTSASVHIGGTVSFDAAVRDASGNAMSGAQVTWRSSDTTIAVVSATGQVTPRRVGTASITASSDQQSGAASLTVLPAAVASVALSPTSASLMTGDTMQFSATPRDGDGNVLAGRSVSWTSSNPGIVTVSSTGLAIAKAAGSAQITATSDSVEESAPVSVVGVIVDSVEVSPTVTSIMPGQSAQFSATLLDSRGRPMKGSVEWSVDDSALASVTATGVVTAKSAGTVTVVATSGKKHGNGKLQIANVAVAAVIVSPATLSLSIGKTSQLTVTLKDSAGNVLTGRTVSWSSSNSSAVSVSSTGVVTGVAAGSATITATSDSRSGAAQVTVPVTPPTVASISVTPSTLTLIKGKTSQLTATPRDSAGSVLAGQTITWATSSSSVATVSSTGVVTAVATGTATITAASNGHSDSSAITVVNAPVASVAETPDSATIIIGGSVQLSASALDSSGNVLTGRTITWSAADSTIASVSASGLVKGVAAGLTQVYATSEGKRDSSTITVSEAPPASVAVTPSSVSLVVGASKQASATVRDANGNVLTGQTVTWKSSATGVATVSSGGMIQAVAVGSATVTATSGGKSGTAAITVTQVPVATVSLSPTSATLSVGGTQQLTATLKDSANNVLSGRTITWQSSATSVATVSSSGVVTALAAGSAVVKATSESKSATASITVSGGTGTTSHSGWYVAPNGSSGGAGTSSSPWSLTTALAGAGGKIQPGDTVWLRGGTYGSGGYNQYTSTLTGTASAPIIVRQYPGERATINGFMTVNGGYTTFWGMEIMDSDPQRTSTQSGSFPTDIPRANYQVTVNGPGTKFINVVVHDLGNGLAAWESATNAEVYGSLFYNNGWQGTDRGHGHGLYIQNLSGTKLLGDNIVFDNFDYGIQIYSQETHINNITLDGNIAFNNSTLGDEEDQDIVAGGTQNGMQNLVATNNATYRNDRSKTAKFGLDYGVASSNGKISGNYFAGMVQLQNWSSLSFTNNTLYGGAPQAVSIELMSGQSFTAYLLNNQQYFEPPSLNIAQPFGTVTATNGGEGHTFADWKSTTGLDGSSSFSATDPTGQQIILRPNKYEAGRANIAVYNWSGSGVATVDLSNVLKPGDQFEVRNAQDFYGTPAYTGTYGGGAVSIPLTRVAPVAVIGGSPSAPPVPAPYFYAFVVVKTN